MWGLLELGFHPTPEPSGSHSLPPLPLLRHHPPWSQSGDWSPTPTGGSPHQSPSWLSQSTPDRLNLCYFTYTRHYSRLDSNLRLKRYEIGTPKPGSKREETRWRFYPLCERSTSENIPSHRYTEYTKVWLTIHQCRIILMIRSVLRCSAFRLVYSPCTVILKGPSPLRTL